jgi:hypothetical protein
MEDCAKKWQKEGILVVMMTGFRIYNNEISSVTQWWLLWQKILKVRKIFFRGVPEVIYQDAENWKCWNLHDINGIPTSAVRYKLKILKYSFPPALSTFRLGKYLTGHKKQKNIIQMYSHSMLSFIGPELQ